MISDIYMLRELNVVVLLYLVSVLSPSSFVLIVASSSVFIVSILVPTLFLALIFSGHSSYDVVKEYIFLSWASSVDEIF